MTKAELKKLPTLLTDEEAEQFIDTADLSTYDLTDFKRMKFEFAPKSERVNMRLPAALLAAVKAKAKARGLPYQRFIREALENAVHQELDR